MKVKETVKRLVSSIYCSLQPGGPAGCKAGEFRVLLYHSIGEKTPDDTCDIRVTAEEFHKQMEYLYREDYKVCDLGDLIDHMKTGGNIDKKSVAITFDDGYEDVLTNTLPTLQKFGFSATAFVVPEYIKRRKRRGRGAFDNWNYLSLEQVQELGRQGISIGSHSVTHRRLSCLGQAEVRQEVIDSQQQLEDAIKRPIALYSYPYGCFDEELKRLLRSTGYVAACSSIMGRNDCKTDLFELRRTEITGYDSEFEFEKKVNGCYDWMTYFNRRQYDRSKHSYAI